MSTAADWDRRFRKGDHTDKAPDPFFEISRKYWTLVKPAASLDGITRPAAIDIACGAGRHAVALASEGFDAAAVDFSPEALQRASELAVSQGVGIETDLKDLESPDVSLGDFCFDLAFVFFYLHRPLFPAIDRCLRPGGLLIYKTYTVDQLLHGGRPRHKMYFLEHNELLRVFPGYRVLRYEEEWEGKGSAALIAQKI
jgi:SAM-dependent methyltransferase